MARSNQDPDEAGIKEIIRFSNRAVGLTDKDMKIDGLVGELLEKIGRQTGVRPWLRHLAAALLPIVAFLAGYFVTLPLAPSMRWSIAIVTVLLLGFLVLLNNELKAGSETLSVYGRLHKTMLAVSRLAGLVALQRAAQKKDEPNDLETIKYLTELLDDHALKAIEKYPDRIAKILDDQPVQSWKESFIEFVLPEEFKPFHLDLNEIAKTVALSAEAIFRDAKFTVKVYLLSEHTNLPGTQPARRGLKMLTAIARYPAKDSKAGLPYSGKSWLSCRGQRGFVWDCYERTSVLVFKGAESSRGSATYESIACIPLPGGLGVITIEASDPQAFDVGSNVHLEDHTGANTPDVPLSNHAVTDEVSSIVGACVRDMLAAAIHKAKASI